MSLEKSLMSINFLFFVHFYADYCYMENRASTWVCIKFHCWTALVSYNGSKIQKQNCLWMFPDLINTNRISRFINCFCWTKMTQMFSGGPAGIQNYRRYCSKTTRQCWMTTWLDINIWKVIMIFFIVSFCFCHIWLKNKYGNTLHLYKAFGVKVMKSGNWGF